MSVWLSLLTFPRRIFLICIAFITNWNEIMLFLSCWCSWCVCAWRCICWGLPFGISHMPCILLEVWILREIFISQTFWSASSLCAVRFMWELVKCNPWCLACHSSNKLMILCVWLCTILLWSIFNAIVSLVIFRHDQCLPQFYIGLDELTL
jgi:hypothetical protein